MAALTDRQKARERLSHAFESILDKMVPADEAVPLPGGRRFVQWEDLADEVDRTLVPMFLEERAALDAAAQADCGGCCPHCHSQRVYLIKAARKTEVQTPHGVVVLTKQSCRCRQCGRSFSPLAGSRRFRSLSRAGLGPAGRSRAVAQGRGAGGA